MNATSAFHARLRDALDRRKMTQTELARRLEVRVATVNEWLNRGTMPSGPVMLRLPLVLDVDGHWLLTGERRSGSAPELDPELRERVAALLDEALELVLDADAVGAADPADLPERGYGRVRRADEGERLALGAIERSRRAREAEEQPRRKRRGS